MNLSRNHCIRQYVMAKYNISRFVSLESRLAETPMSRILARCYIWRQYWSFLQTILVIFAETPCIFAENFVIWPKFYEKMDLSPNSIIHHSGGFCMPTGKNQLITLLGGTDQAAAVSDWSDLGRTGPSHIQRYHTKVAVLHRVGS